MSGRSFLMKGRTMSKETEKIETAVDAMLRNEGMELVDLKVGRHNNKTSLMFFVERLEGHITLDDCETLSDKISGIIDMENLVPGAYVLEISSPGVDRLLKKPEHFRKFAGSKVRVFLKTPVDGVAFMIGAMSFDESGTLTVNDGKRQISFKLDNLKEARLEPELAI